MLHNMYISRFKTCLSVTKETAGSGLHGKQCFVLFMKYTLESFAPSYIFHNQHKTWNNLLVKLTIKPKVDRG